MEYNQNYKRKRSLPMNAYLCIRNRSHRIISYLSFAGSVIRQPFAACSIFDLRIRMCIPTFRKIYILVKQRYGGWRVVTVNSPTRKKPGKKTLANKQTETWLLRSYANTCGNDARSAFKMGKVMGHLVSRRACLRLQPATRRRMPKLLVMSNNPFDLIIKAIPET